MYIHTYTYIHIYIHTPIQVSRVSTSDSLSTAHRVCVHVMYPDTPVETPQFYVLGSSLTRLVKSKTKCLVILRKKWPCTVLITGFHCMWIA